jgi:lipopolysaccharide/colanic/teichoic acid biosynthesis glycosyltransferase
MAPDAVSGVEVGSGSGFGSGVSLSVSGINSASSATVGVGSDARARIPRAERCLDITLTIVAMPVLIVVAAAIALAIYLDSPGPVLYRSRRVGRDGEPFEMLKFRKMSADAHSHPVTLADDDRFTPIGRFLSATRLDELPQVINVLRGEMRLVGPRPELERFVAEYAAEYAEILTVTPGLTGRAQLRFVDERALLSGPDPEVLYTDHVMPLKVAIDLDYVQRHTLVSDLLILARTVILPVRLTISRARSHPSIVRIWIPAVVSGLVLALAFIIAAARMP